MVSSYDDTVMGFHEVTQFYYHPGWWEPGPSLEVQIPLPVWNELPEVYQEIIKSAAYEANSTMMAKYDVENPKALQENIIDNPDITILPFPDDVMEAAEEASFEIFDENAANNTDFKSIFDQWSTFREGIQQWHGLAEQSYLNYIGRNA